MDPFVRAGKTMLDFFFPPRCFGCETVSSTPFCAVCNISVDRIGHACQRCGLPVAQPAALCVACRMRPPPWDSAQSVFLFGGSLADAVKKAKYADQPEIARGLGQFLPLRSDADVVVPVPLHPRRLRARGFNQASQLLLGAGATPDVDAVVRIRDTAPQARLTPAERRRNMAGAFEARVTRVRRRRVLVIDDVLTTGATMEAVATSLLAAGAAEVHVLTLARAVP
jgi:ComF family protein